MRSPSPNNAASQIATFHTHLGAMRFYRRLLGLGDEAAALMPAPRKLSASCGTCVQFHLPFARDWADEDLDAVYAVTEAGYQEIFSNPED